MPTFAKRILVVGGAGGVGRFLCREVIRLLGKGSLIVGDYKPERGQILADSLGAEFRRTDVLTLDEKALDGADAVVVAMPQSEPRVQAACIERRIACFDIASITGEFAAKVETLDGPAQSTGTLIVVTAGLIPGLSGVIVKRASKDYDKIDEIHVGLLENTKASSPGPAGFADWFGMLAKPVIYKGQRHHGFSVMRRIVYPEPFGERTVRLFDYPEGAIIRRKCNAQEVYYWTAFDKESINHLLGLLRRLRVLDLFNAPQTRRKVARIFSGANRMLKMHDTNVALTVEVSGIKRAEHSLTRISIVGPSDYGTTAMATVAMAKLFLNGDVQATGVRYPMDMFTLTALITAMDSPEVKLFAPAN